MNRRNFCDAVGLGIGAAAATLRSAQGSANQLTIMAELDPSPNMPLTATTAATVNRDYLRKRDYTFRA